MPMHALTWPGPFELLILMTLLIVPAAVILLLLRGRARRPQSAFPVIAAEERDGPGKYRVVGVDKDSRGDRELTLDAANRDNARAKAEFEGLVVTRVEKIG